MARKSVHLKVEQLFVRDCSGKTLARSAATHGRLWWKNLFMGRYREEEP